MLAIHYFKTNCLKELIICEIEYRKQNIIIRDYYKNNENWYHFFFVSSFPLLYQRYNYNLDLWNRLTIKNRNNFRIDYIFKNMLNKYIRKYIKTFI